MRRGRSRSVSTTALARQASEERRLSLLVTTTATPSSTSPTTHTTSEPHKLSVIDLTIPDNDNDNEHEHEHDCVYPGSPTDSSSSSASGFMTPEPSFFDSSIPPPLTLEDQLHVAYALDDIHLAKILLLKLKGIEVTSDSDPRIAAVKPEDFDECFIPAGGLTTQEDEEAIKEMQRVERERLQMQREERLRRDREETEQRRRREWEMHCEKIWEGEKKRLREEKEFLEKKREEERKKWEEGERRQREAAERRASTVSRYSSRSSLTSSKPKPRLSYAALSTDRIPHSSSSTATAKDDDDRYLYSFLPIPKALPPPQRRRRCGGSPPSQSSSPLISTPYGASSMLTLPLEDESFDHRCASRNCSSSPEANCAAVFIANETCHRSDSSANNHLSTSSSPEGTHITVSFRDVLTSMRGSLFPETDAGRPRNTRASESRDGRQSQSSDRLRSVSRGRQDGLAPLSLTPTHALRRRKRDEELLSSLLVEVKWAEGERLLRGKPRRRNADDQAKTAKAKAAGFKQKARTTDLPLPIRHNSSSSITSNASTTSSCAACAVHPTPASPVSSTSSVVSRAGSWLSSFSSSSSASTEITTPSTSFSSSPPKVVLTHVHRHVSTSTPTVSVRSTVSGWLRKTAIAAAAVNQVKESQQHLETQLAHSCHRSSLSPFSQLTRIMAFEGPLPLHDEDEGNVTRGLDEGGQEDGDSTFSERETRAASHISINGAGLARQVTRFVELARGFQTAYINATVFGAVPTLSFESSIDPADEERRRRGRHATDISTQAVVTRKKLLPAGYRATKAEVEVFSVRRAMACLSGSMKDKDGILRAQNNNQQANEASAADDSSTSDRHARDKNSIHRNSLYDDDEEEGVEYIPLLSPHPPPVYPPRTMLPHPLPYALVFKPPIPLVLSPHRRASQQREEGFEDNGEFGSLSQSLSGNPSIPRGTGRFSSRLSSSPPPRSASRVRGTSRSSSHSPPRRTSLARLVNPQFPLRTPAARPRFVGNPIYLRLKAAKNSVQERGVDWDPPPTKTTGSLSQGKEKMLVLTWDEIGRSLLGQEQGDAPRRGISVLGGTRPADVDGLGDRRGRNDRVADGFNGVRRGRCVVRG